MLARRGLILLVCLGVSTQIALSQNSSEADPAANDTLSREQSTVRELAKWHRSRESSAYSEVCFRLAKRLRKGDGCRQDHVRANNLFNALKDRMAEANFELGSAYESGLGVRPDIDRAFDFFDAAADRGYAPAEKRRAAIADKRFEDLVKEHGDAAEAVAIELYGKREPKSGLFGAKPPGWTGREARLGGPKHPRILSDDAIVKEAARGNAEAQWLLGLCHLLGRDLNSSDLNSKKYQVNEKEALAWFEKSAQEDYLPAHGQLGEAYFFGQGIHADPKAAREHLEKASADKGWTGSLAKVLLKQYEPAGKEPSQKVQPAKQP